MGFFGNGENCILGQLSCGRTVGDSAEQRRGGPSTEEGALGGGAAVSSKSAGVNWEPGSGGASCWLSCCQAKREPSLLPPALLPPARRVKQHPPGDASLPAGSAGDGGGAAPAGLPTPFQRGLACTRFHSFSHRVLLPTEPVLPGGGAATPVVWHLQMSGTLTCTGQLLSPNRC